MFGFLKKKLKETIDRFSSKAEEVSEEVSPEEVPQDIVEQTQDASSLLEEDISTQAIEDVKPIQDEAEPKDSLVDAHEESSVKEPAPLQEESENIVSDSETDDPVLEDVVSSTPEDIVAKDDQPVNDSPKPAQAQEFVEQSDVEEDASKDDQPSKDVARADLLTEDVADATKKKKGFFSKLKERFVKFQLTEETFEEIFWEFELGLLEQGVALEVIEKIKQDLHDSLTSENISRSSVSEVILSSLRSSLRSILDQPSFDLLEKTKEHQPLVIAIVGVNGSGKTTTLAKLIQYFKSHNKSVVVAAADTFRAAAIDQLQEHTDALEVKLIKQAYGSDSAAVAFDAIAHAKAKGIDVVLVDTAGRLQSNSNLMDELAKLIRVNKPHLNLFIGEAITGNDCVQQAVAFDKAVGIDGMILSKADVDQKGGAALSASFVTKKPILFLGVGQTYDDLESFDVEAMLSHLGV